MLRLIKSIDDLNLSFHTYNKKVVYLKLIKTGNDYRSRIGYNLYSLSRNNKYYTIVVEWLTTNNNAWSKMENQFNVLGNIAILSDQTKKFQTQNGLYYTRSIVQIKINSFTPPIYLLSTIHIDGDSPTFPKKFSAIYNIVYATDGNHSNVPQSVYDYHSAFEISNKTMKINVDIDKNGQQIVNSNLKSIFLVNGVYKKVQIKRLLCFQDNKKFCFLLIVKL